MTTKQKLVEIRRYTELSEEEKKKEALDLKKLRKSFSREEKNNPIIKKFLILHPIKTRDKNGTPVEIREEHLEKIKDVHNKMVDEQFNNPFASIKSFVTSSNPSNYLSVPIILNHNADQVENRVGFIKGYLWTERHNGMLGLFANGEIIADWAKPYVNDSNKPLLREVSVGLRADYSIKELSFVNNNAAPYATMLGESDNKTINLSINSEDFYSNNPTMTMEEKSITTKMSEVIDALELKEQELSEINKNIYIENSLHKLSKQGKIIPAMIEDTRIMLSSFSEQDAKKAILVLRQQPSIIEFGCYNRNLDYKLLEDVFNMNESESLKNIKGFEKALEKYAPEELKRLREEVTKSLSQNNTTAQLSEEEHKLEMENFLTILSEEGGSEKLKKTIKAKLGKDDKDEDGDEEDPEMGENSHLKKLKESHDNLLNEIEHLKKELNEYKEKHKKELSEVSTSLGNIFNMFEGTKQ